MAVVVLVVVVVAVIVWQILILIKLYIGSFLIYAGQYVKRYGKSFKVGNP